MSLIYCPECKKLIFDNDITCPKCGFEIQKYLQPSQKQQSSSVFKWIGIIVLVVFVLLVIENATKDNSYQNNNPKINTTEKWYDGGTLHKATIAEWRTATAQNKLATCSDFIAKIRLDKGITYNEAEIKIEAYELMKCIDEANKGVDISTWKVVDIAAPCLLLLNPK